MDILIKPILTEKMTVQGEKLNRYGFIVDPRANKLEIKAAVERVQQTMQNENGKDESIDEGTGI